MKGNDQVIQEFNEVVNMTASELEKWLKSDDSNSAGWPKEDENGETVGHDSGRKIVEILKENPKKDANKYTDEQVQHMRKVVSYCNRHLAQEAKTNNDKSPDEVKKTKSYASLKNWGHDFLKAQGKDGDSGEQEEVSDEDAEEEQEGDEDEKQTGEKRRTTRSQTGPNKKRETRKGESSKSKDDDEEEDDEDDKEEEQEAGNDDEAEQKQVQKKQSNGQAKKSNGSAKKTQDGKDDQDDDKGDDDSGTKNGPKKGETVSWNWGQGQPKGEVLDVKAEDTSITTKNGNQVSRKGDEEDPAVVLDTGKNKAIKKAHELN
ncbi:hypothetical protein F66182_4555 [Fusarium sp. NRRL 66182]|nr:hypothetical protein F66182_4555 [Fusarium sp. NRRL 66182]